MEKLLYREQLFNNFTKIFRMFGAPTIFSPIEIIRTAVLCVHSHKITLLEKNIMLT